MPSGPLAAIRPSAVNHHGVTVTDDYAWLRDPGYPDASDVEILAHLRAENAHFEGWAREHVSLIDTIEAELKLRIVADDAGVPVPDGAWENWWRFAPDSEYRQWLRRPRSGGDEEMVLDEAKLAEGKSYFRLGGMAVSPDGTRVAYAVDDDGSERFALRIRDLATATDLVTIAANSIGAPVWANDGHLAWVEVNDQWRPWRVRLHVLGSSPGDDPVSVEEADAGFFVGLSRSQDRHWLIVRSADHETAEVRLIAAAAPLSPPLMVSPRQTGRDYDVDVHDGTIFVRANDTHENFRIATAPVASPGDWSTLIAGSERHYLRGLTAFARQLVVEERIGGLDAIRVRAHDGGEHWIDFPEASFTASLGSNPEPDPAALRLGYSSLVTPQTVFDYDLAARTLTTRKVQSIPSGYDPALYETRRLHATAADGARVPVSLVMRCDRAPGGPLHLYGYGAYGIAIPPSFSASRLSLLDRGVAFAIAHIRGGDDLGYGWYKAGKREQRTNTFTDFIAAAHALIAEGVTAKGHISISGGSAGGTLMGAVLNMEPDLWSAAVAHVPFVDVLGTMLDASLPLTPIEWPEWGNPIEDAAVFAAIRAYSPYDNVQPRAYPPLLVTAGLNDPRVTYWEPAKWVARLRAVSTGDAPLLMKTNMDAGHGGKSGRYAALRETAEEYAFVFTA